MNEDKSFYYFWLRVKPVTIVFIIFAIFFAIYGWYDENENYYWVAGGFILIGIPLVWLIGYLADKSDNRL